MASSSSFSKANTIAITARSDVQQIIAQIKATTQAGQVPTVTLPPNATLSETLLATVIQQLADIQVSTRATDTGSLPGAGWYVDEYSTNLPNQPNNLVQVGQTITVVDEPDQRGELYSAGVILDNPYVTFSVVVTAPDGTKQQADFSPWFFQECNHTSPNNKTPYLTRYDTTNNIYAMEWGPSPGVPYNAVKVYFQNPPVIPVLSSAGIIASSTPNTTAHIMFLGIVRRVFS